MHTEVRNGPNGRVEQLDFSDGKLQSRSLAEHDAHGNLLDQQTYDSEGRLISHISYRYDEQDRLVEWRVTGPQQEQITHILDRYEGDYLAAREWYDAEGRMFRSVAVRRGDLTSWWQAPDCMCADNIGFVHHDNKTITYFFRPDGSLNIEVEEHTGRYGNLEPDVVTLSDTAGNVREKVAYRYDRDRFGNWTSRLVSVWNPETGQMVTIRQDTRVLTYY